MIRIYFFRSCILFSIMASSSQNSDEHLLEEAIILMDIGGKEDLSHNYYAAFHLYVIAMQKFNTYIRKCPDPTLVQNLEQALGHFNNRLHTEKFIVMARVNVQLPPRQPDQRQISSKNALEAVRLAVNVVKADMAERRHRNRWANH